MQVQNQAQVGQGTKFWHPELSNIQACIIGDNCVIHSHTWIGNGVTIGDRVRIQAFSFIPECVIIEDDVFIAPRVTFTNDRDMKIKGREFWQFTRVKKGAKIGAGTVVVAGITIGKNAFIGAGSVVTKDIPDYAVAYGNPARVVRMQEEWVEL